MNPNPLDPQSLMVSQAQGMQSTSSRSTNTNIIVELTRYSQQHFTGKLEIVTPSGQSWQLYLHLGRLVWATGGQHPRRRWRRHYQKYCATVKPEQLRERRQEAGQDKQYQALYLLVLRQLVPVETVGKLLRALVTEVLFDLLRAIAIASVDSLPSASTLDRSFEITEHPSVRPHAHAMLPQTILINLTGMICEVETAWHNWVAAGLTQCSPDLAPTIGDLTTLQQHTNANTYQRLCHTIDGKMTLRDLAAIANTDVLTVTRSLLPYIRQQLIGVVQVSDLALQPINQTATAQTTSSYRPLIFGIDDNAKVMQSMQALTTQAGYRYRGIIDATNALIPLLEAKPDLIFLDLVMPIANGYELCAQIRRIPRFQDTPIVILTGKDGLIDRMRAKVVGATDFVSKPIETEKILAILRKYV
jgi:chemotaxis family two-component system response regulator PixG